jgi:hypothetical protein
MVALQLAQTVVKSAASAAASICAAGFGPSANC